MCASTKNETAHILGVIQLAISSPSVDDTARDRPDRRGTSGLSPHLRFRRDQSAAGLARRPLCRGRAPCPGSNPANWQWVAGSGADAAPNFRVFNPIL
jgi:hypothetical protein